MLDGREHDAWLWCDYEKALELLFRPGNKELLKRCQYEMMFKKRSIPNQSAESSVGMSFMISRIRFRSNNFISDRGDSDIMGIKSGQPFLYRLHGAIRGQQGSG